MKRFSFVLRRAAAAVLLLTLLLAAVPSAYAAGDRLYLSADKTQAAAGEVITLQVCTDATEQKLGGIQFIVQFDTAKLELVENSARFVSPYTGANVSIKVINPQTDKVNYVIVFSRGMKTGNAMAQLQLKVKDGATGTTAVELAEVVAADNTDEVGRVEMSTAGVQIELVKGENAPAAAATPQPDSSSAAQPAATDQPTAAATAAPTAAPSAGTTAQPNAGSTAAATAQPQSAGSASEVQSQGSAAAGAESQAASQPQTEAQSEAAATSAAAQQTDAEQSGSAGFPLMPVLTILLGTAACLVVAYLKLRGGKP